MGLFQIFDPRRIQVRRRFFFSFFGRQGISTFCITFSVKSKRYLWESKFKKLQQNIKVIEEPTIHCDSSVLIHTNSIEIRLSRQKRGEVEEEKHVLICSARFKYSGKITIICIKSLKILQKIKKWKRPTIIKTTLLFLLKQNKFTAVHFYLSANWNKREAGNGMKWGSGWTTVKPASTIRDHLRFLPL